MVAYNTNTEIQAEEAAFSLVAEGEEQWLNHAISLIPSPGMCYVSLPHIPVVKVNYANKLNINLEAEHTPLRGRHCKPHGNGNGNGYIILSQHRQQRMKVIIIPSTSKILFWFSITV